MNPSIDKKKHNNYNGNDDNSNSNNDNISNQDRTTSI